MSAKGRITDKPKYEFYETPAWVTNVLINSVPELHKAGTIVLDPCAGRGAISRALLEKTPCRVHAIDIDPTHDPHLAALQKANRRVFQYQIGDFFTYPLRKHPDAIIANPPFSKSMEFATKCLDLVAFGGVVAFLLRLNWLEGIKRYPFHREHPCDLIVLPKRPSFTGHGTDATAYAWFVWGKGRGNRWALAKP